MAGIRYKTGIAALAMTAVLLLMATPGRAQHTVDQSSTVQGGGLSDDALAQIADERLEKHKARYLLLSTRYASFAEYLYHYHRRRADKGKRLLVGAGILTGVSAALFLSGLALSAASDEPLWQANYEFDESVSQQDNRAATARTLLTLSLYTTLGAIPLWIVGGAKKKKHGSRAERIAPYLPEHRRRPVALTRFGMGPIPNGIALVASAQF